MKDSVQKVCGNIYMPTKFIKGMTSPSKKNYRSLVIRTYCPPQKLLAFLSSVPCLAWSYCTHDKDVDEEGNLHMPHTHCVVHFDGMQRLTKLAKYLDEGNSRVEPVLDKYKSFEYLIHANSPDKYQYDISERHSLNESFYIRLSHVSKEERRASEMQDLLNDVLDLTMRDFALKYGRDGILHYNQYVQFAISCTHTDQHTLAIHSQFIRDKIECAYPEQVYDDMECARSKLISGLQSLISYLDDADDAEFPSPRDFLSMIDQLVLSCNIRRSKFYNDDELDFEL